jgi:thiamine biosynthesis lipoprotein
MSKTSTELVRHALSGPTMGTRWSALFFSAPGFNTAPVHAALEAVVEIVDAQMSTWRPTSALMRLNSAPVGEWTAVPAHLFTVLRLGLKIGDLSGGAFDIGMGDAVTAWGFGPEAAKTEQIGAAMNVPRLAAHHVLDIEAGKVRKRARIKLDLNGIAKGYGVDQLAQTLSSFGIVSGLVSIDGEMRALGPRPDGEPWTIAVEKPDYKRRAPHSILELYDAAVATSGDYRHWVDVGSRRFSHTMDPVRSRPLSTTPASVTVVAPTCMAADAWATALMVRGSLEGSELARRNNLEALFIDREGDLLRETRVGRLFGAYSDSGRAA